MGEETLDQISKVLLGLCLISMEIYVFLQSRFLPLCLFSPDSHGAIGETLCVPLKSNMAFYFAFSEILKLHWAVNPSLGGKEFALLSQEENYPAEVRFFVRHFYSIVMYVCMYLFIYLFLNVLYK